MRKTIFPLKDTALFEEFPTRNTGLDEILEIGKTDGGRSSARSLIQFDLTNLNVPASASFDLILRVADAQKLKANQGVEVWQLNQTWTEGTGYLYQSLVETDDGATWTLNTSGSSWASGSVGGLTASLYASNTFSPTTDFTINISTLVRSWLSGSANSGSANYGLVVKFPDADEQNTLYEGNIKFFSAQTHTIYKPTLIAKWDDQTYTPGTSPWPSSSLSVIPATLAPVYRVNDVVRVDLAVRETYPLKTFNTASVTFSGDHYLPSSSYFSIVDDASGTVIIPFDDNSKVHSVGNKSYISFRVQDMYPNRSYRLLFKVEHNGLVETFDNNSLFRVK